MSRAGYKADQDAEFVPVSADYDGDGLLDPAVYNQATGAWIVLLSCNGYAPMVLPQAFGGTEWDAVPGDYDGDGLADLAVRNAKGTGEWRVMLSSDGYTLRIMQLDL